MPRPAGGNTPLPNVLQATATRTGPDHKVQNAKCLILVVTTANKTGTPTVTPSIQGKTASGAYYTIWTAAAAIAANGTFVYILTPFTLPTGTFTEAKIMPIPSTVRAILTYAGTPASDKIDMQADIDLVTV